MSQPAPLSSSHIKRSASEQLEEPPTKRADIHDKFSLDYGHHREHFSADRRLAPEISRAETAQFQDYSKDMDWTGDAVQDVDDSDEEFLDAQENFIQGGAQESAASIIETATGHLNDRNADVKNRAGNSPLREMMEIEEIDEAPEARWSQENGTAEVEEIKQEMSGENKIVESAQPMLQLTKNTHNVKPETISFACDSSDESEDGDADTKSNCESSNAENETKNDHAQKTGEPQAPISIEDDEPFEDMFAATFGNNKEKSQTQSSIEEEDSVTSFSGAPGKKNCTSGVHATTIRHGSCGRHISTPPSTPPPTVSSRPVPPPRRRPDITRDLSHNLVRHEKFHTRAQLLIPRLPNHENFNWTRRYWIAVLIEGKRITKSTSEKDFVWMKGNRFSTVATVFHSYALAVMANPDDLALVLGSERVEMTDQMQELDYFNDRLVVFKAVKIGGNEMEVEGRSLVQGVVPESATITLDFD